MVHLFLRLALVHFFIPQPTGSTRGKFASMLAVIARLNSTPTRVAHP